MNEHIERRLEQLVARAVRPLWASRSRKRAMQEELLAHAAAVFDEEYARLGDERAALEEACDRIGFGDQLGFELQECIPWLERLLLISEREILMSRWFWLVAVIAVFVGPALVMPAVAHFNQQGVMPWVPLMIGVVITLAGLGGVGYGVMRRFVGST